MNKKQIKQEFKKIDYEFRFNKPAITPYPSNIIKKRELLLYAQATLSNILAEKLKKDKNNEKFQESLYKVIISNYYKWDNNEEQ